MDYIIKIKEGIYPFESGKSIVDYTKSYQFGYKDAKIGGSWNEYYFFDDTIDVYVNKITNIIESIRCSSKCFLDNIDLIGLDIKDFFKSFIKYNMEYKVEKIFLESEDQDIYDMIPWVYSYG